MAASCRVNERNGLRVWLFLALVATGLQSSSAGVTDCPALDSDAGFNATGYPVTVTDTDVPIPGYLTKSGDTAAELNAETTGTAVSTSLEVQLYCAEVVGAGCDGQPVTDNTGIPAGLKNWSYCLGCAGTVNPVIDGLGAYNESIFSTCSQCSCNATGQPFREGIGESFGRWNSTGNCTVDPVTGSGQCNCSQLDGTVITPLGPYQSYGNCSACGCDVLNGTNGSAIVLTPETFWNITDPNDNFYPVYYNKDDPLCFLANCTCDANGTVLRSSPVTYNITGPSSLYYSTILKTSAWDPYCFLQNCSCDEFGNVNASYFTTYNETKVNASNYYVTIQVLDNEFCYFDNCSCDAMGNLTTRYTTTYNTTKSAPSLWFTTIQTLSNTDPYCFLENCTCDEYGNSTSSYTTTINTTKANAASWYKTITNLSQYCHLDNCTCDAYGNSSGSYTTTYAASAPSSNYFVAWNASVSTCSAANCTCGSDGTVNTSVSDALCNCQCRSCATNATCGCDLYGNESTSTPAFGADFATDATAQCGCACTGTVQDCGCGCGSCEPEPTCTCDQFGNSTTSPNTAYDDALATCGCGCTEWLHDCGCGCSSCDTQANCSCDAFGNSSTSPSTSFDSALATCGCQCDEWIHDCGCSCSSCDSAATCACDADGNVTTLPGTAMDLSAQTCGCQCDAWEHDCGCECESCAAETGDICQCDGYGNSSTNPNTTRVNNALDVCGCGCDTWIHDCGCECDQCSQNATCLCDQTNGSSSTLPSIATDYCGCGCIAHICECSCERLACDCQCEQECGCNCTRNECGYDTPDGKNFTPTGGDGPGGSCTVQADCGTSGSHPGFYAGGLFTAYTGDVTAKLVKNEAGVDSTYGTTFLTNAVVAAANGAASFSNLLVTAAATFESTFAFYFSIVSEIYTTNQTAPFTSVPAYFTVRDDSNNLEGLAASVYQVSGGFADLGNFTLTMYGSDGSTITNVTELDGFNVSIRLYTGPGGDSSSTANYQVGGGGSWSQVDPADLMVIDRGLGVEALDDIVTVKPGGYTMDFSVAVVGHVGYSFRLVATVERAATTPENIVGSFRIDPAHLTVSFGDGYLETFGAGLAPKIVRVNGGVANFTDQDGLPGPLRLNIEDDMGLTMSKSYCVNCAQIRLLQCSDAFSASMSYPACSSTAQAYCATRDTSGAFCNSSDMFLDTLTGTTTASVINGTAEFTDIQLSYVFGAGYKLQFTLNGNGPGVSQAFSVSSAHTNGQIDVPDDSYSVSGVNNSFFVRPYELDVAQDPGGDGIDTNLDGVPDGVAIGIPFRVQPAVSVKGDGYYFDQNWNRHGFAPVTAILSPTACNGDCSLNNLVLSGTVSGVSTHGSTYTATTSGLPIINDISGNASTVDTVDLYYDSVLGTVGQLWRDLQIATTNDYTGQENVALEFRCGPNNINVTDAYWYTSITGAMFDVMGAPDPPLNLRVSNYDNLGFRIEFDPAPILRTKPLSGYIIEIDECVTGTNYSCQVLPNPFYDAATYGFTTILGSDFSKGGGYTEEILVTYSNVSAGEAVDINLTMTPAKSLYQGDSLAFFMGAPNVLFSNFSSTCALSGDDASKVTMVVDATTSQVTLTVNTGYNLVARDPVELIIPSTCNALMPGGAVAESRYGSNVTYALQNVITAAVLGEASSTRFDNCKQGNSSTCHAAVTYVLPTIQDSSSMDMEWSGALQYGATGAACRSGVLASSESTTGTFPSNRYCSLDTPNSNDPDSLDGVSTGNSGDNGSPIGSNPGRGGSGGSVTTGTLFPDTDNTCRDGTASKNPCALTIGQDWQMGVNLTYTTRTSSAAFGSVKVQFKRARALAIGDKVLVPLDGLEYTQPDPVFPCTTFSEGPGQAAGNSSSVGTAVREDCTCVNVTYPNNVTNQSCTCVNVTYNVTDDYLQCELLSMYATENYDTVLSDWMATIHLASSVLTVTVGSNVPASAVITLTVSGFTATQKTSVAVLADEALAEIVRGSHTTIIVKTGAIKATYSSASGDPIASYAQGIAGNPPTAPGVLTLTAGKVYTFRVYAYNGRFKSTAAETLVQNRAITPPSAPAYFIEQGQRAVGANYYFSNLAGAQKSNDAGTKVTPTIVPSGGATTRVGIFFTPDFDVLAGQTVTFELPGFTGPDYLEMGDGFDVPIFANIYEVVGNSSSCGCSATGTISTPSKTYTSTSSAVGTAACNYSAPNVSSANDTVPWCACGDCSCSLAGVVSTPTPLYNVSGNCSGCDCTATGTPVFPDTIYNVTGNCSSCACDSSGTSSFTASEQFTPDWSSGCDNCTCNGLGNATCPGGDNPACTCSFQSCDCGCNARICDCQCPTFRECTCGCPVNEIFECECIQNISHPVVNKAIWSGYSKSIVLIVSEDTFLPRDQAVEIWIPRESGIMYPSDSVVPLGPDSLAGGEGIVNGYKLNWASAFPTATQPREGFIVQMTTDIFWRTDVQTVMYSDVLDRGVVRTRPLTHLAADMTATDTTITLPAEFPFLRGQHLKIGSEFIFVKDVNGTTLTVLRGRFKTTAAVHQIVVGTAASGSCSCADNSTTLGGGSCVCTSVQAAFIGATDPSVSSGGLDTSTGSLSGTSCTIGGTTSEGCNPSGFNFVTQSVGVRTFQSAFLEGKVTPSVRYATACGGTFSTCTSNCLCVQTTPFTGYEFGNNGMYPKGNNITIASIGDPFAFPLDYRSTLELEADALADSLSLVVADATGLANKYIRVNNEIMFVEKITRGVMRVDTYQSFGGSECSCTVTGTAIGVGVTCTSSSDATICTTSNGVTCSCIGDNGINCTEAGVLSATGGGGGKGFRAEFNISSAGAIDRLTVTSPGYEFTSTPTIYISSGGIGCLGSDGTGGPNLKAFLSSNVLKVTRGALGTTAATHAVGSSVSAVLWPSQTRQSTPGLRYNFRIAAFNSAGLSPFIYFQMKLLDVFPRTLPAAGNVPMEIILIGGGTTAGNYTLYIGYLNAAGNVDLGRTKKCNSLVVQDPLGTRMSCQSPSWVGARHSLILHFQSGSQEQIAVGNNWIRFEPPELTMVQPAQLDAMQPVNITITGRNFGLNSSVVTGRLQANPPIPCTPVTVLSDLKAICTLIPKIGDVLTGDIILTVGNAWSGGGQSTKASANSKVKEKPAPVVVESTIPVAIESIPPNSPERVTFVDTFATDVSGALGVAKSRVNVTDIRPGSVIITFVILPDPNAVDAPSPAALAVELAAQAADPASPLRQGTLTSTITVSIPPGTAALAAAEAAATTTTTQTAGDVPLWESSCVPKSYTAFDMEICYDCCTYVCEIGVQVPQVGGQDVLPGYRAQTCQGLCLVHCGYSRPIVLGV